MATKRQTGSTNDFDSATSTTQTEGIMDKMATRFILQAKPKVKAGLRVLPAVMLLMGVATMSPAVGATSCAPANVAVSGGNVSNRTDVSLNANGGTAVSTADGGNNNTATGGNAKKGGNGGDAAAGNAGTADAQ